MSLQRRYILSEDIFEIYAQNMYQRLSRLLRQIMPAHHEQIHLKQKFWVSST
jgi:hypothetical protein